MQDELLKAQELLRTIRDQHAAITAEKNIVTHN
jgi:hypothetical protein